MKRGCVILIFLILFAFILNVSSGLEKGNPGFDISNKYFKEDTIKGWINISLENENTSSLFRDSLGNSISLIKLLKLNSNLDYECSPSDCESNYNSNSPETGKTFALNQRESKTIGFVLTGNNFESLSDFSLNVSSDAGESTRPQLSIDILNDREVEWSSYKPSNNFYNENKGCYDSPDETVLLYNQRYCEKINIPKAPNVEIGAYVIEDTGGEVNFRMIVCDENYINCNNGCTATASTSGRISCVSNETIEETRDYFVCISTESITDNNKYKINSETKEPCGFANVEENERDFDIFAKPGKYRAINEFALDNAELQSAGTYLDLKFYIEDYLNRYNNSCTNGCIVPINFTSSEFQTITLSKLSVTYTSSGTPKEASQIYGLTEIPAKVNSGFGKINLDVANFSVSGDFGDIIEYTLNLNGEEIFSEEITIEKIPQIISLNTDTAIAAFPTEFIAYTDSFTSSLNSSSKAIDYTWDFGDGKKQTTQENKATHTYDSIGAYELRVSVKDINSLGSSKTFNITVKTPKEAINSVLKDKLDNLNNISSQLGDLPVFKKESLSETLNFNEIGTALSSLQKRNASANSDDDYVGIMKDLVELRVPKSVFQSQTVRSVKFYPEKTSTNLDILKAIAGDDYNPEMEEGYKEAILSWYIENIDSDMTSEEFSANYETSTEKISNFFQIKINENQNRNDSYFIIPKLDNLKFRQDYGEKEISDYIYIKIQNEKKTIEFSTTEDILFSDLPAFISPPINELTVSDINITESEDKLSKQTIFVLSVILAFFVGFIAYLVLQAWYKKRYEDYLFRNKNHLYNIVSYIENSKRKKVDNREIEKKLRKSGWRSEQIKYVMRKYAGKRTGMFEIPVEKILSRFKRNKPQANARNKTFKHSPAGH